MDGEGSEAKCIRLPATTGPRPYKCEVCQRSFREIATLRKHEQLHRADRPYVCTTCSKSFLWSSNLKVHERVHTGERPYKCKICHRCFTQSNDLRRHERNVHMRGKLVNYKNPTTGRSTGGPVNVAAYQAFAMQQRALLQHALTYESLMQNVAVASQSRYMVPSQLQETVAQSNLPRLSTKANDLTISTSSMNNASTPIRPERAASPIKLEQVTPPSSPRDSVMTAAIRARSHSDSTLVEHRFMPIHNSAHYGQGSLRSPTVIHSPQSLPTSTYQGGQHSNSPSSTRSPALPHSNMVLSPTENSLKSPLLTRSPSMPHSSSVISPSQSSSFDTSNYSPVPSLPHHRLPPISTVYGHTSEKVMDLSLNKSVSSGESDDSEWKGCNTSVPSKSPTMSEAESDEKRDVTTTSASPGVDSGIHHCPHCNIVFQDYTMFHLHQSLHSPMDDDPFRCPSCKHLCQDRIEFMFHLVWHVKYPHTIPNYQPFKESYLP